MDVEEEEEDEEVDMNVVHQAVSIMKSCLQSSTKELNEARPMEIDEVTDLIKTMNEQFTCNGAGMQNLRGFIPNSGKLQKSKFCCGTSFLFKVLGGNS